MKTTVSISDETHRILKMLKERTGARSYNELLLSVLRER